MKKSIENVSMRLNVSIIADGIKTAVKADVLGNIGALAVSAIKAGTLDREVVTDTLTDSKLQTFIGIGAVLVGAATAGTEKVTLDGVSKAASQAFKEACDEIDK